MSSSAADLFGTSPIAGLAELHDVVTPDEEAELIVRIDATALSPFRFQGWLGKRLTTSYGLGYDFEAGRMTAEEPLPDWLLPIRDRAARFAGLDARDLVQALLTRYDPGAGIGWHRDRPFYEHVTGISLGTLATLRFRRHSVIGFDRVNVTLVPRSIDQLEGEVRHDWEHSIAAMTEARWSITFRTLSVKGRRAVERMSAAGDAGLP